MGAPDPTGRPDPIGTGPNEGPPRLAERLLALVLGTSPEAATILGDLAEDYAAMCRRRGSAVARLWYWKESMALATSTVGTLLLDRRRGAPAASVSSRRLRRTPAGASGSAARFVQDVRYAVRALRRSPGLVVFATLIVGLGVGGATAVYSVMSPLLIRPLPFDDPGRLVLVENVDADGGLSGVTSRTSNLRDFRERARSFDGLAGYNAFSEQGSYNLVGSGTPERLTAVQVTDDFLDVLGVDPVLGRDFTAEEGLWSGSTDDADHGVSGAVVLTHGFWVRRFGSDPGVVGSSISLNDAPHQVVGVLPPDFDFSSVFAPTATVDILLPWPVSEQTDRWGNTTTIVGRLTSGASVASAQAELDGIIENLESEQPDRWGLGAVVSGLQERIARPYKTGMLLLAAAAGLLILIVCVNLSNLLLARSPRRRKEMAIRRTMGATRGRLIRQLLVESTLMSLLGAVLGIGIAWVATRFVAGTRGLDIPMLSAVGVDASALAFSVVVALAAGLAVGAVPALQVAEGGEAEALSSGGRGSTSGVAARRFRELLVIVEVGMACILIVFGGLVLRSFQEVMEVDLGFDSDGVVAWQLASSRSFETLEEMSVFYDEIVRRVEAVPGVRAAGLVDALPLGRNRTWGTRVVGEEYGEEEFESFFPHLVDHRYLTAMGVPLLEGRHFTPDDDHESAPVAIVGRAAARRMFDGDPVGRRFSMWYGDVEVVGVVEDVKHRALELAADNQVYFPVTQVGDFSTVDLVVRSALPAASVVGPVSRAIRAVAPRMPTEDYRTMASVVERAVSPRRFTLRLLAAFAASALLLAGLGIYAVLSHSVSERVPEIGIRMALGESAAAVRRSLVGRTVVLAVIGVVLGSAVSLAATRSFEALLYGVEPTDPLTFAAMVAAILGVTFVSALIPAIRASRTDSAMALRAGG